MSDDIIWVIIEDDPREKLLRWENKFYGKIDGKSVPIARHCLKRDCYILYTKYSKKPYEVISSDKATSEVMFSSQLQYHADARSRRYYLYKDKRSYDLHELNRSWMNPKFLELYIGDRLHSKNVVKISVSGLEEEYYRYYVTDSLMQVGNAIVDEELIALYAYKKTPNIRRANRLSRIFDKNPSKMISRQLLRLYAVYTYSAVTNNLTLYED